MTDTYNDTTGSRKKFLIPLVVLLLCAVSLTGAGYAYSSSVENSGDTDVDYAALVFTNQGGTEMTSGKLATATGATFTSTTVIYTPRVTVNVEGTIDVGVYFKYVSDKDTANYTVAGTLALKNAQGTTVTSVDVTGAVDDHKTVSFAIGSMSLTLADGTSAAPATLVKDTVYMAHFAITPTCDVQFANATAIDDVAAVVNAVNALDYNLTLTSTNA